MSESQSHKRAKAKAPGKKECTLKSGKRIDSISEKRATEVERSGTNEGLGKAAQRLKESKKPQKVLQVPQGDMDKAAQAMKSKNVKGTVKNLSGTKKRSVR